MTDVFLSYAREDRARIEKLAAALEAQGVSVWWDRHIAGGSEFTTETETRLNAAKAILVAWSKASVPSMWVGDEAAVGRDKGNLVPVAIDAVAPKLGFRGIHTIDLAGWNGDAGDPAFEDLVRALKARISGEAAPAPRPTRSRRVTPPVLAALAAGLVALIGAAAFLASRPAPPPSDRPPGDGEAADASIAVLPFADMSPGKDQEYFSDGMAEEILNVLARIDGLTVASRTSAFAFRDSTEKASDIAATLNVAYLLEGSVRRDGERLRITAQLIDAAKDRHLWSEAYDRNMADVFAVQQEIAGAIGAALSERIGAPAAAAAPQPARTDDLAAYDKYLKARSLLKKRGEGLREAIGLFKEVVAADPGYAPAWSGLVQATEPVIFYLPEAQDPFVLAEYQGIEALAARMAVDRDPGSAEALGGMADHLRDEMRWAEAEEYYRRALAIDSNDVEVIEDFQEFLHRVGRTEEALKEARRGQVIEPLWPLLPDWEAIHLHQLGQRARARAVSEKTVRTFPEYSSANNTAFAFALNDGRFEEAARFAAATPAERVISGDAMRRLLDWTRNGRDKSAEAALPRIIIAEWFAMLAAAGADDLLYEMLAQGDPRMNSMALMRVAAHERLRCDPRFRNELIRARLPEYWRARGWPRGYRAKGTDGFECVR